MEVFLRAAENRNAGNVQTHFTQGRVTVEKMIAISKYFIIRVYAVFYCILE